MPAGPWADWPETLAQERLEMFLKQDAQVMSAIQPPIPNIGRVAPRFGFRNSALTIQDVVRVNEIYQGPNTDPLTQRPGYSGSALPGWSTG